ncbi:MAG: transposase, partial [Bacilli bacterium]|nr:transposase [Bacilli bacterium]
ISLGNKVYVEKMNFAGLQKRAKNTEKNDKGKFKKKKRFGKSLANKAPSMLLTIIDRKLGYYGEKLIEINTFDAKASQFNHFDGTYTKKPLSQRWNDFNGIKIQRDIYSAFLIMNINDDLKSFDIDKCNDRFENFHRLHDLEVERLMGKKNLRSIAI